MQNHTSNIDVWFKLYFTNFAIYKLNIYIEWNSYVGFIAHRHVTHHCEH